jgi:hypothetical protein
MSPAETLYALRSRLVPRESRVRKRKLCSLWPPICAEDRTGSGPSPKWTGSDTHREDHSSGNYPFDLCLSFIECTLDVT